MGKLVNDMLNGKIIKKAAMLIMAGVIFATGISVSTVEVGAKTKSKKASTSKSTVPQNICPKAKDVPESSMHAYVQSVIAQITTPEMTNDQKLAASYNYVLAHMKYKRDTAAGMADKVEDYALEAFFTGQGNCYRYAAMFAYMARELGYNAVIHAGECSSNKGGMTPHSWVQIYYPDGRTLVYDGSFGDSAQGKKNYFGINPAEHSRILVTKEIWTPTY